MAAFCIQCKNQLKANYFVAVCSFCCYLAHSSIGKNLVSYLTKVLHETNVDAARNVSTWQGTSYLAPLVGAFVADSYLGKYRTALISCAIFVAVSARNHPCPFILK
jgi:peptide/histidine transporter 3/4